MKRFGVFVALAFVVALLVPATASAANLVTNGDFEAGNTGFTSGYDYFSVRQQDGGDWIWWPAGYAVGYSPFDWHGYWPVFGDHTSGSGKMQIVNGAMNADLPLWSETVAVEPSHAYRFSFWMAAIADALPGDLEVRINGVAIGSKSTGIVQGDWQQAAFYWNSGRATTARIDIVDKTVEHAGNDFAIDDVSFDLQGTAVTANIGAKFGDRVEDTYMYSARPTGTFRASTANFAGRTAFGEERIVMSIPLAKLSGSVVSRATLGMMRSTGGAYYSDLRVYRLQHAVTPTTSWNAFATGSPWALPGASGASDFFATPVVNSSTSDFAVGPLVQAALAEGDSTLDLMIIDPSPTDREYVGFYSSECVYADWRPQLVVEGVRP